MLGKKTAEPINAKISSVVGADMVVEGDIRAKEAVRQHRYYPRSYPQRSHPLLRHPPGEGPSPAYTSW